MGEKKEKVQVTFWPTIGQEEKLNEKKAIL